MQPLRSDGLDYRHDSQIQSLRDRIWSSSVEISASTTHQNQIIKDQNARPSFLATSPGIFDHTVLPVA
jgi:hypothetical protein